MYIYTTVWNKYKIVSYSGHFYLITVGVEGCCCTWSHSVTHTHTHTHTLSLSLSLSLSQYLVDSSGRWIIPSQKPPPDNTQYSLHKWQTHDLGRVRNRNPSKRAAADPRLRSGWKNSFYLQTHTVRKKKAYITPTCCNQHWGVRVVTLGLCLEEILKMNSHHL